MAKGIPLMGRGPDSKAKIINVDENGNVKVQQSGTNVEEIVMVHGEDGISHTHLTNTTVSFYPNWSSGSSIGGLSYSQRWTEASKYKDKLIAIRNRYDVAITLRLYDQTRPWGGDEIFTVEVPAGANAYITALEYPKLTVPAYNLIFGSRCESLATEGTLTVRFRGRL